MALIKCPECGKEISEKAKSCPNCGYPIWQEQFELETEDVDDVECDEEEEEEAEERESKVSIASLVVFILGAFLCFGNVGAGGTCFLVSFVLVVIAHFQKNTKCVCATIVFWVVTIGFALSLAIGFFSSNSDSKKQKSNDATYSDAEDGARSKYERIGITSTELIDAWNDNQVKCKKEYDGKKLEVTGTVQSIGTDIMDSTYVCLGHDTDFTFVGIQCYTKDENMIDKIAELKEGDLISVVGKGECGSLSFSIKDVEKIDVIK